MARYKLTTIQKLIVGVGLALLLLRLLQEPAIFNPLINFLGAGVVPGTQQTLSPDAILKLLLGVFIAAIVVLFVRLFLWGRLLRRERPQPEQSAAIYEQSVATTALLLNPLALPTAPASPRPQRASLLHRLTVLRQAFKTRLSRLAMPAWLPRVATMVTAWVSRTIAISIAWVSMAVRVAMVWTRRTAIRLWAIAVVLAVQAWDWAEPHVRRFDAWLAVQLNGNEFTASLLEFGRRAVAQAKAVWHKAEERIERHNSGPTSR